MSRAAPHPAGPGRVDLHLHSRASTDTGSWFVRRAAVPESHTAPAAAYATAKARGMDVVALTDHNTIAGALEIAHHPDVLIGAELTARFPEDGVPVHVLAWGLDEATFADADRLRGNLYELVAYLGGASVPCALAHPLHRVGDVLDSDHLERCLLLFTLWEGLNGARPAATNEVAARIARAAHPDLLVRLAEKHGIAPRGDGPPALVGGSDDHGGFDIACAWTEMRGPLTPARVVEQLRAGRVHPAGRDGSAEGLAHSVGALATVALAERGALRLPDGMRAVLGEVLQRPIPAAPGAAAPPGGAADGVMAGARRDRRLVRRYRRLSRAPEGRERSHARIRLATGWIHARMLERVLGPGAGAGARAEALAGAVLAAAPYLLASRYVAGEEAFARRVQGAFFGPAAPAAAPAGAVMLTDTFDEVNGVAGTMRRLAAYAGDRPERGIRVLTCAGVRDPGPGRVDLAPVARVPVPGYDDASLRPGVPSMIDVLDAVRASGAAVVHAATPGPMGLAGLAAARALGLPFAATWHTEFARYAHDITGDRLAAAIVERAMSWFHGQAERLYVPTAAVERALAADGVPPARMVRFGRGADLERFGPHRATRRMAARMRAHRRTVVLYVGRLSPEKDLDVLADAMRHAGAARDDLELCVVGDGPARGDLARRLRGVRHRFLGTLRGDDLAAAYACADIFLFPSGTETYGQVVVEAAASGLPRVVSDAGAACEHVRDGATGLVVRRRDAAAFARAVLLLADDARLRRDLGARARRDAGRLPGWDEVFDGLCDGYATIAGAPAGAAPAPRRAAA